MRDIRNSAQESYEKGEGNDQQEKKKYGKQKKKNQKNKEML